MLRIVLPAGLDGLEAVIRRLAPGHPQLGERELAGLFHGRRPEVEVCRHADVVNQLAGVGVFVRGLCHSIRGQTRRGTPRARGGASPTRSLLKEVLESPKVVEVLETGNQLREA